MRSLVLLRDAVPGRPALDAALSRALLEQVATGAQPETLRLYRPDDVLAFSGVDAASPGFRDAVVAAHAQGFAPALRLAGGRAAAFTRGSLAFAWALPAPDLRAGIAERFDAVAGLLASALRRLGVDARVGEVPGEYCPGVHSVNAGGRRKLAGIGQRVVRGAAHVGGVLVVRESERLRAVLGPVYTALGLAFDPASAGSVEDEIGDGPSGGTAGRARGTMDEATVVEAIEAELRKSFRLETAPPGLLSELLAQAEALEPRFLVPTR